jgi:excisionase family DNA binding protein
MLTPAELAAELRTSERTIARMVADGCPSLLVGSRRRFDRAAVLAWAQERAACQFVKTPKAAGTLKHASGVDAFTAACRQVQLRVMPSGQNQT